MKCFYILNPHANDFTHKPLSYFFFKKKPHLKYSYIVGTGRAKYCFNLEESSFFGTRLIKKFFLILKPLVFLEIIIWLFINKKNFFDSHFHFLERANKKFFYNVLVFSYKGLTDINKNKINSIRRYSHFFVHLSHYMIRTSEKARNLSILDANKVTLLGDSDFSDNEYFRRYFPIYSLDLLPFCPARRFKNNFRFRVDGIYAGGTIHDLSTESPPEYYSDFIGFFKCNSYHTVREFVQSMSLPLLSVNQSSWADQKKQPNNSYFKADLVEVFNEYKFVLYGTELSGAPSISSIEAMFCGSIALLDRDSIRGLPFKEGVHYLHIDEDSGGVVNETKSVFHKHKDTVFIYDTSLISLYHQFLNKRVSYLAGFGFE